MAKKHIHRKQVLFSCKVENKIVELRPARNSEAVNVINPVTGEITDSYHTVRNTSSLFYEYGNFCYILNDDGSLWDDGCLWLWWCVSSKPDINYKTLKYKAEDLAEFKAFCDGEGVEDERITDYRQQEGDEDTPTHRFRNHLISTKRTPSASKRVMSNVCMFFEWMRDHNVLTIRHALWQEEQVQDKRGKTVNVKDVCQFRGIKSREPNSNRHVNDGDVLRPLPPDEQEIIMKAYEELGNPEYHLLWMMTLDSKARKQTLMTLRLGDIVDSLPTSSKTEDRESWHTMLDWIDDNDVKEIMVGEGHDADSKRGLYEAYPIKIKGWLWKKLVEYIGSERAFKRRDKALPQDDDNSLKQYLFLSQRGHPYYHAKNDRYYHDITTAGLTKLHDGDAMDKWISQTLKPYLRSKGYDIEFHYHDGRATGAANFLREKSEEIGPYGNLYLWKGILNELSLDMNHSSQETTAGYLQFMEKSEKVQEGQKKYEDPIEELIEGKPREIDPMENIASQNVQLSEHSSMKEALAEIARLQKEIVTCPEK